jgi:6-phosphogluconolactonase
VSVTVLVDRNALMRTAAERVIRAAGAALAERGRFNWALSGGSTPAALFRLLASPGNVERIDWLRVHFFWSDERSVAPDHADSNFRMAREALLDAVAPPPSHVHRLRGELPPAAAAEAYEAELARCFGVAPGSGFPAFDLVLLGMGADGHTASLFPGTSALRETQRWVVENDVPSLGTTRLTFTLPLINAAQRALFLVTGADKAERLEQVVAGRASPPLPAQLVRPRGAAPDWLVDAEAGSRLGLPTEKGP